MNVVLIFDVSENAFPLVRETMRAKGYYYNWNANDKLYILPQNIVWKPNIEFLQAKTDLSEAIQTLNTARIAAGQSVIELLRYVALSATPWDAIQGKP